MAATSVDLKPEHLARFFSTAKAVRDRQTEVCPILQRLAVSYTGDRLFNLHPEVARIQRETDNDPIRVAFACLAAVVGSPLAPGIMFQALDNAETLDDLHPFPFWARHKFPTCARKYPNDIQAWWHAYPWDAKGGKGFYGANLFVAQWLLAAPLGVTRDACYAFRSWPEARYGIGWLEGNTTGKYWMKGNMKVVRDIVHEVLDRQYDPEYYEYNADFEWTAHLVPAFAEIFGRHSFELLNQARA